MSRNDSSKREFKLSKKIYLLACAPFAVLTGTYGFLGLFVQIAKDLDVSVGAIAQLLTVFSLAAAFFGPFLMTYSARVNNKAVIILALLSLSLLDFLSSQAFSFKYLLVLRLLSGIAASQVFPLTQSMATYLAPLSLRGRSLSKILLGNTIALIFGIPLSTYVGNVFGWRSAFGFCSMISFAVACGIIFGLEKVPGNSKARGLNGLAIAFRTKVSLHLVMNLLASAASRTSLALLAPVAITFADFASKSIGFLQFLAGVGTFVGARLGGYLADKKNTLHVMMVMFLSLAMSTLLFSGLIILFPNQGIMSYLLFIIALVGAEFSLFAFFPNVQYSLVLNSPDDRATLLSLSAAFGQLGQALGAATASFIFGVGLIRYIGFASVAFTLVGMILCFSLINKSTNN